MQTRNFLRQRSAIGVLAAAGAAGLGYFFFSNRGAQAPGKRRNLKSRVPGLMVAEDIMTSNPKYCLKDTSIVDVARMMVEFDCGEIPVVDSPQNQKPIGVVTDRDIVARLVAQAVNPLDMHAETCMSAPVVSIRYDTPVRECIRLLETNQIRRIPVTDEEGRLCGIVSEADIARFIGKRKAGEVLEQVTRPSETSSNVAAGAA